ncbi:flagellar basal body rod protein FlgB [Lederbergia lenta]|uniref:Flagellar basal body rod protein FlgB n=1 Tax=Lederbergia lenta TaxID=1467 RepID=A0A2X4WC20_LEDLE|nr:flagellar basal body rod protein FlgB [Lederbergia lenta]MCM3110159.1 flagellar basal body rod protein FlgB [Lederbergia lenta]MEC2324272.1 flagellar basal body rod protein FlgB [Lederbergia lenta]SQI60239.1 flagellar basal-body rod protein FlgB [Lederbergia lenta]
MDFFSGNINTLEKALNYSSLKHKVTAENIANVDVPNYKGKDVSFKQMLREESGKSINAYRSDPRHYQITAKPGKSSIITNKNLQYNHNGNNVDMDKEMANLATNQIYYNALIDRLNSKFSSLSNVIRGGR